MPSPNRVEYIPDVLIPHRTHVCRNILTTWICLITGIIHHLLYEANNGSSGSANLIYERCYNTGVMKLLLIWCRLPSNSQGYEWISLRLKRSKEGVWLGSTMVYQVTKWCLTRPIVDVSLKETRQRGYSKCFDASAIRLTEQIFRLDAKSKTIWLAPAVFALSRFFIDSLALSSEIFCRGFWMEGTVCNRQIWQISDCKSDYTVLSAVFEGAIRNIAMR